MMRAFALVFATALAAPALAAEPVLFGPAADKLPDAARFRLGRPTENATTVLAFSADGKTIATITNRGYIGGVAAPVELWNVETGKHLHTLRYHHTGVMAAAFSPDGSVIATSGIDNRVRFWDGKTGKDITKAEHIDLTGHGYALWFAPDGKRLLIGSTKLEMYDVATQQPLKKKEGFFAETATNQFFHTATWSSKGKYVAGACDGQGVRVWDADTGNLLYKLTEKYTPHRTRFAFSPDDKLVLLATWPEGLFKVFDAETGKEQNAVKAPAGEVAPETVQFAREMGRVAWVVQKQQYQQGRTIAVSDATGAELKRFDAPGTVSSHLFSHDGKRLAVGGNDGSLRLYEAETGVLERTILGAWSAVFRSVYTNGGKVLRTVHSNGTVHDFDADTGKHLNERTLKLGSSTFLLALSGDGTLLASATDAGACTIWDLTTGEEKAKPKGKLFGHREMGFGGPRPFPLPPPPGAPQPAPNDGECAPPPPVAPIAPVAFPPPPPFERQPGPPQFVAAFSADGKLVAAITGEDDTVTIYDTATGAEKFAVKVPKGTGAVAVSADGTHLFAGQARPAPDAPMPGEKDAEPVTIRRYELKTGKEVQSWKGLPGEKRLNHRYTRTEVLAIYPLADKETLLVVEAQVYMMWPPPPIPAGGRVPEDRISQVRVVNLAGREKDKVVGGTTNASLLAVAPDGKSVGFVAGDTTDATKPATMVKVLDVASGKLKATTVATGHHVGFNDPNQPNGVSFRTGGTDIAVRIGDGTVLVIDAAKLKDAK